MKYKNIQPKIATICLIHLINTVESSDNVSRLLNIEFTHNRYEISLLDFQKNAVFNPLNEQSKSFFICSLISLFKALLFALTPFYTTERLGVSRLNAAKFNSQIGRRLDRT
jgi:hypothetical protein